MNKIAKLATLAAPAATLLTGCSATTATMEKPNVVILFVDDMGWADLGMRNSNYQTPHLDKLAAEGINYTRAYVPTATSSPSRAALLTGKESLRIGFVRHIYDVEDLNDQNRPEFQFFAKDPGKMLSRAWLPLEERTYAEVLKEQGYYNQFVGKWHLGHDPYFPIHQGFDDMYGTCEYGHPSKYYQPFFKSHNPFPDAGDDDYLTDLVSEGAENFIANYDKDQPFLLNVWYYTVHGPRQGRKDLVAKYKKLGMDHANATYAAMLESLDSSVGRIREALEEKGIADNTIIIFSSDQGGAMGNAPLSGGKLGGNTLGEGGCRVPFFMYVPGAKAMGTTYDEPIQTIDVFPTLAQFAGADVAKESQIQGVSLFPTFDGETLPERDLFMHRSYEDQNSAIMNGDWKLIKYRSGKVQLFNIVEDISEQNDLSKVETKRTAEMLARLNKWQTEVTPKYLLKSL